MNPLDSDKFEKSVVVVAHPDDEVLWFSSILNSVDQIAICFLNVPTNQKWSRGRERSLSKYPLNNLTHLDLTEADVFWDIDWESPVETSYGLAIVAKSGSEFQYVDNYEKLKAGLESLLDGARNVFTHNPWGEYGNAEHIQVYRAIRELQGRFGFNIWVTGYFSNKTALLMSNSIAAIDDEYFTRSTNIELALHITNIYKSNQCWTWYDDYRWPESESFFLVHALKPSEMRPGLIRPLQFIYISEATNREPSVSLYRRARRILGKVVRKLRRERSN